MSRHDHTVPLRIRVRFFDVPRTIYGKDGNDDLSSRGRGSALVVVPAPPKAGTIRAKRKPKVAGDKSSGRFAAMPQGTISDGNHRIHHQGPFDTEELKHYV